MSQLNTRQQTFGATLVCSILHNADDDPKGKKPYALNDAYFIEFEGEPEALAKAISALPMVEFVATQEIKRGISEDTAESMDAAFDEGYREVVRRITSER